MFMPEVPWVVGLFFFYFSDAHYITLLLIADEARSMLQGVGSRFDFHINKTLCDLRFVLLNIYSVLCQLIQYWDEGDF